ncbi:phospholipid phosphatase 3-like [Pseudorca crassidens]|uniref:phospholipid phosphatase 3-like n=1 Tax=Pseudorca crassidens TaxID=82174 RepID=UPI00352CB5FA
MEGTHLPSLALSPKITTRESPKVCNAQHGDRWPRRTLVNSDMTLTRGTLKKGFFCNDTTIQYPRVVHYIIEDSALIKMGFFISIFTISLGELIRVKLLQLSSSAFMSGTYTAMIYKQLGTFIFGGLASCSPTSIANMTTGHLRPHFLATCLPDPASFDLESGYVTNYTCTGHPKDVLHVRRLGGQGGEPRRHPHPTPAPADVHPAPARPPGNPSILWTPPSGCTPWCIWW